MTTLTLTHDCALMDNYLQGEVVSPQAKFEALQTADGHALLFSLSTDGAVYLTAESSGQAPTGWTQTDLSSATVLDNFPKDTKVATFDVGQSAADGSIGLAMAVRGGDADTLYLALGLSDRDAAWAAAPPWKAAPFDAEGGGPSPLRIAGVYFTETSGGMQYVLVDVLRDPSSKTSAITRYVVDPAADKGPAWVRHDLPIDIEAGAYDSVVGRIGRGRVDGVYTIGKAGTSGQMVYVPVVNVFGDGPPMPSRFSLPGAATADAIAVARNADQTTELFAVGGDTLFHLAAAAQTKSAATVVSHAVIAGTRRLIATERGGVTTVWGLNGDDQVYSLSAPSGSVGDASAWSTPLPVLDGIEAISTYLNRAAGDNTIFASGGGRFQKVTQASGTGAKMWRAQPVMLAAPPDLPSLKLTTYTTTLKLAGADGQPAQKTPLAISAAVRTPVFMNGLYYVLGPTPVHVETDAFGAVTVIDVTDDVTGAVLTVSAGGGAPVTINPMDTSMEKITALNTADKLRAATVTRADGSTAPLAPASASDADLKAAAGAMDNLRKAYHAAGAAPAAHGAQAAAFVAPHGLGGVGDAISVAAGDLYNWLKTGVDAVVEVVEDAATGLWRFVAKIAGKVYHAVLDSAEAVVGAARWIFKQLKTALTDLLRFLMFLFEWHDIQRTQAVLHTLVKRFLEGQVAGLDTLRKSLNSNVATLENSLADWAGITDWSGLGAPANKPAAASGANPTAHLGSGANLLAHHYQTHANSLTIKGDVPEASLAQKLIDDLMTALKSEAQVLGGVYEQLVSLAKDFATLSVADVLKRLTGILLDSVLSSAQVVIDALLAVLRDIAATVVQVLDAKIHIPVISDILNDVGVHDPSFLDLFTYIAAAAVTVVYKATEGAAPFPDDEGTRLIRDAKSWDELEALFHPRTASAGAAVVTLPDSARAPVYIAGNWTGCYMTLLAGAAAGVEAESPTGESAMTYPAAILGAVAGATPAVTNYLVPRAPLDIPGLGVAALALLGLRVLVKLVFANPVQKMFKAGPGVFHKLAVGDGRATGAVLDAVLAIPSYFITCAHLGVLAVTPPSTDQAAAVVIEGAALCGYAQRVAYSAAVNVEEERVKQALIVVLAGTVLGGGMLFAAAAMIEDD